MELIWSGLADALARLARGDPDLVQAAQASLFTSGIATLLSVVIGVPLGAALGLGRFRGRNLALALANTGMGFPPVVIGLLVVTFIWRSGPLGPLELYCTRQAMIIAQLLLAAPTVIGLTAVAVQSVDPALRLQLLSLGASRWQALWIFVQEARLPILTAAMAGFGAVISEVGASQMTGCNIRGDTRILTTAIWFESSKGDFGPAYGLAFILLALIFAVNALITWAQQRRRPL